MVCELLLENGADPLAETKTGVSPLYVASRNGHRDVVKALLKFGADATRVCAEVGSKSICTHALKLELLFKVWNSCYPFTNFTYRTAVLYKLTTGTLVRPTF